LLLLATLACGGEKGPDEVIDITPTFLLPSTLTPDEAPNTLTPIPPASPVSDLVEAEVIYVVDGDTIDVLIDGVTYRVRYIGIDTPETKHPTRGVEPFGPEATETNRELVQGKNVLLEKDVSETDRYGRLLRYVYTGDLMVNEELLRRGLARVATFPPDVGYVDRFLALQREAQAAGLGVWGNEPATPQSSSTKIPSSDLPGTGKGYTYQQPDGNRLVPGQGALPNVPPLDIALDAQPQWLVAGPTSKGSLWVTVLVNGRVQAFHIFGESVIPTPIATSQLPPGTPPLLSIKADLPTLVIPPAADASFLTHPILLSGTEEQLAFIEADGDLVIWDRGEVARLAINALPDARLLVDKSARILLLGDATTRYDHGVLGDAVEAASITLIETVPKPRVVGRIPLPHPSVVEGVAPIWTDLTGDGKREIIVTLSDAQQGARIVVFNEAGEQIAIGPAIGKGYRWRHHLVVAPFGPNSELELADVLTPHLGGVVEFFRLSGSDMEIVAQVPGYTSHVIGTRNLDMAVAGDVDGDGRIELLLPNQARTHLAAIRRNPGGAEVAWAVSVSERVSTNIATVTFPDGTLAVGVGHEGNKLRLWLP
jgi:endonuclease YncB( thermonuclease family)